MMTLLVSQVFIVLSEFKLFAILQIVAIIMFAIFT